jgi:hypothetical protein
MQEQSEGQEIVEERHFLAELQSLLGLGTYLPDYKQTSLKALEEDNMLWDNPDEASLGAPSNQDGELKFPTDGKLVDTNTEMSRSEKEAAVIEKTIKNTAKDAKAKGLWSCPFAVQVASSLVRLLVSKSPRVRELAASSLSEYAFLCFESLERLARGFCAPSEVRPEAFGGTQGASLHKKDDVST